MSTKISTTLSSVSNKLKSHKAEALQRIRLNTACLVTTLVISYLLPLPSIPSAMKILVFNRSSHNAAWSAEWIWERVCVLGAWPCFLVKNDRLPDILQKWRWCLCGLTISLRPYTLSSTPDRLCLQSHLRLQRSL